MAARFSRTRSFCALSLTAVTVLALPACGGLAEDFRVVTSQLADYEGLHFAGTFVQEARIANQEPWLGGTFFSVPEVDITGRQVRIGCHITPPDGVAPPKRVEVEVEVKPFFGAPEAYQDSVKLKIKADGNCRAKTVTVAPGMIPANHFVFLIFRPIGGAVEAETKIRFEFEIT